MDKPISKLLSAVRAGSVFFCKFYKYSNCSACLCAPSLHLIIKSQWFLYQITLPKLGMFSYLVLKSPLLCGYENGLATASQTFNRVCSSQNSLAELLEAFNSLCGCQSMCDYSPQAFNRVCSSRKGIAEHLQSFNKPVKALQRIGKLFFEYRKSC